MTQPSLRPQDILVLAKLLSYRGRRPPMAQLGIDLSISSSEIHAALKRLALCRLVSSDADGNRPLLEAVEEFLVDILALIDAIRAGRARERKLAAKELSDRIRRYADDRPESDADRKRR